MTASGERVAATSAFGLYERFSSYVTVEQDLCAFFERSFLHDRHWQAAIVSEEPSSSELMRIALVCQNYSYTKAWALDVNSFNPDVLLEIQLQNDTLTALGDTFLTPSYLVVEEKERFMLVSDGDHYWEIAGSQDFLEGVFQKPLGEVDRDFMDATRNYRRTSSRIGRSLSRMAAEIMERSLPLV